MDLIPIGYPASDITLSRALYQGGTPYPEFPPLSFSNNQESQLDVNGKFLSKSILLRIWREPFVESIGNCSKRYNRGSQDCIIGNQTPTFIVCGMLRREYSSGSENNP